MPRSEQGNGAWLPVFEWLLAIAAGTSVPVPEGITAPVLAKLSHLIGSAVFAFFTFRALRRSLDLSQRSSGLTAGVIGGFVLTLSEARQSLNPSRMSLLSDATANLIGVVLGGTAAAVTERQ